VPLSVAALTVRRRWIKHTYPGSAPLPDREPPPDNRWQRGDVIDALYLADTEATAWAEWYRHLAERMIPPLAQMPRERRPSASQQRDALPGRPADRRGDHRSDAPSRR
jgi:hypothetical protein